LNLTGHSFSGLPSLAALLAGLGLAACYSPDFIDTTQSPASASDLENIHNSPSIGDENDGDGFDWSSVSTPTLADHVVLPEEQPCIESVFLSFGSSLEEIVFEFSCDPASVGLEPGDIVVGTQDGGYLREIVEIEHSGYSAVARTRQARLADVLLEGGFHQDLIFENEGRYGLDYSGKQLYNGEVGGAELEVRINEGVLNVRPELSLAAEFGWFSLKRADAILRVGMDADLEILAELSDELEFSGSMPLGKVEYPFAFAAGPIPVAGTLELALRAGLSTRAEATATATVGMEAESYIKVGGQYRKNEGWSFIQRKEWDAHRTGPDLHVEGNWEAKVWIEVEARVMLYNAAGPSFTASPFLHAEADAECYDLDWEARAGAEISTAINLDLFVYELEKSWGPWTFDTSIGEGTIALPFPLGTDCEDLTPGLCTSVASISCGDSVSGDTRMSSGPTLNMDSYPINVGSYDGPEMTYTFVASSSNEVEFGFVNASPLEVNHDIIILDGGSGQCINTQATAWGLNRVRFEPVAGNKYYVVVDGYNGDSGAFELELDCNP